MKDPESQYLARGWWQTRTLSDVIRMHANETPESLAFAWAGTRQSWRAYNNTADDIASRIAGEGAQPGSTVLVFLPDGGAVHSAFVGCERAGVVAVGVGWRAGRRELTALCEKTMPQCAILPSETPVGTAASLCSDLGITSYVTIENIDDAPRPSSGATEQPKGGIGASDLWLINSTSGTTGLPKCVMQTQNRWFYFHQKAMQFGSLSSADSFMSLVPAPFGFGLWTSHFTPTLLGSPCHVQAKFNAREAAETIEAEGITVLSAVSSQFVMILDAADGLDLSSLRVMFTGGERLPLDRSREFEDRTGCAVLNFYGSNETGLLSGTRITDPLERRISSGGQCIPEMQVRLYDDELRRIPGDVGTGRPACRGPATSPGYYRDPEANEELLTDEGWMLMGDYVEIDEDRWLRVVGRSADFVIRGGKNISAAAVEECVSSHPAIARAAVIAVPDARLGEVVGLCVELRPGYSLDLEELKAELARQDVTKEWWPERLAIMEALPTSSGGKIAKGELRECGEELFQSGGSRATR